jgi:hypothetical protein
MHASLQKQIAFNRRALKTEEEVSGINFELADFLNDMRFAPENPVFVCVNVGHTIRGTQPVGSQLWTQESRQMTATNPVFESLDNSREFVALSAVLEALAWRHAMEEPQDPDFKRPGQRVIVYPKLVSKFGVGLSTGNVGFDVECGCDLAYVKILE